MDVLSEVLKTVKLDGALFFNAEFSAPWCFCSPASQKVAPYLSQHSKHVIIYHLLTEGLGYAQVEGDDRPLPLAAGDIVIFPHGDPHTMRNGPPVKPVDTAQELQRVLAQGLKLSRMGGGGEITKFICGYMTCDPQLSRIFLGGLPPVLKVSIRNDASGQWLENSIRYSVDKDTSRPGGEAVLAKLCEVLFVETLRRYIAQLPRAQTGWLAGVRDPEIGKALALLHRKPADPWTIAAVLRLAVRFHETLPPANWASRQGGAVLRALRAGRSRDERHLCLLGESSHVAAMLSTRTKWSSTFWVQECWSAAQPRCMWRARAIPSPCH